MTSIERTAYPRFKRFMSARELHVFYTPQPEEIAWARRQARSDEHLLALMVLSPYLTMRINRSGVYATDEISIMPEQYDAHLPGIDLALEPAP